MLACIFIFIKNSGREATCQNSEKEQQPFKNYVILEKRKKCKQFLFRAGIVTEVDYCLYGIICIVIFFLFSVSEIQPLVIHSLGTSIVVFL